VTNHTITIDLDKINAPDLLQTAHAYALERLVEQVNQRITQAKPQLNQRTTGSVWVDSLRPLDQGHICFIDGTRGAGKTTFLRAACHALCNELSKNAKILQRPEGFAHTLGFLGLMDPSRVENGEKILLNVVRAVQRRVEAHTPHFGERTAQDAAQQFRATLEKLARGLNLLREKHDPLEDVVDPEVFVSLQLERVDEGERLRSMFHELLEHACQVLSVGALVLAFDDADTSAHKGREVMECLRKYLNSPRLVVLVAGDMELYAQLARRMLVDSVGDKVVGATKERETQHHRMLDHLEEQYLLKVFPANHRFRLQPLGALPNLAEMTVSWTSSAKKTNSCDFRKFIDVLLQNGLFVKAASDLQIHRDYFLGLPIRSVLQVMARCAPLLGVPAPGEHEQAGTPATSCVIGDISGQAAEDTLQSFQRQFTEAVRNISLGGLYANGINVDAIASDSMAALCEAVFDLCVAEGDYDTAAYLRPQSTDENRNACFFALSAEVARLCIKRPDRMLRYMLQGPATVSLFGLTQREAKSDSAGSAQRSRPPSLEEFKDYMAVGRNEDSLNWAWHAAPLVDKPIESAPQTSDLISRLCLVYTQIDFSSYKLLFNARFVPLALLERFFNAISGYKSGGVSSIHGVVFRTIQRTEGPPTVSMPRWLSLADGGGGAESIDNHSPCYSCTQDLACWVNGGLVTEKNDEQSKIKKSATIKNIINSFIPSAVFIGKVWTRYYFNSGNQPKNQQDGWDLLVWSIFVEELFHHLNRESKKTADEINASNEKLSLLKLKDQRTGWCRTRRKTVALLEEWKFFTALLLTMPISKCIRNKKTQPPTP